MSHDTEPQVSTPIELSLEDLHFIEGMVDDTRRYVSHGTPDYELAGLIGRNVFDVLQNPQASEALRVATLGFGMGTATQPDAYAYLQSFIPQNLDSSEIGPVDDVVSRTIQPSIYENYSHEQRRELFTMSLPGLIDAPQSQVAPEALRKTELFTFGAAAGVGALAADQGLVALGVQGLYGLTAKPQ